MFNCIRKILEHFLQIFSDFIFYLIYLTSECSLLFCVSDFNLIVNPF